MGSFDRMYGDMPFSAKHTSTKDWQLDAPSYLLEVHTHIEDPSSQDKLAEHLSHGFITQYLQWYCISLDELC